MDSYIDSNSVVKSLWIGSELSTLEILCIKSFLKNGHSFHLYTYGEIGNLPAGTTICPARAILDYEKIFLDSQGGVAAFSDWFRYKLLYDTGGWWVDMDMVCLRRFNITENFCFACERINTDSNLTTITTGAIKALPGADFLKDILEYIEEVLASESNITWGEFGPALLNEILIKYDSREYIQRPEVFCPISWYDTDRLVSGEYYDFPSEAMAVHFWNEIWRRKQLAKNGVYSESSIYETLKKAYL